MRASVTRTTTSTCRTPTTAVSTATNGLRACAFRAALLIVRSTRGAVTGMAGTRTTVCFATIAAVSTAAAPACCGSFYHPCRNLNNPPLFSFSNYHSVVIGVVISRRASWGGLRTASMATSVLSGRKSTPHIVLPVIDAPTRTFL